ncbi:MAG: hypothetical protein Q7S10_02370 [bacterium]|nr:hypothetical protein [bacterium]
MFNAENSYFCGRSERGLFAEIYFPKRAAYYGSIFDTLRYGYDEEVVKEYLQRNAAKLIAELKSFPDLFNPHRYDVEKFSRHAVTVEEALQRIEMYKSPFKGWSAYSVDGVFFGDDKKAIEEATQVVRIMFRFNSSFAEKVAQEGCSDVLRAIIFWIIGQRGHLEDHAPWSKAEQKQFMARHVPWPKHKELFARKYFPEIARETIKWIDDRALFVFGYLVRKFWQQVVAENLKEDEIWVTTFFDMGLNVVQQTR